MSASLILVFAVFVANIIGANIYYLRKVANDKNPSGLPSKQIEQIKKYLKENNVGTIETYFLKYSFYINIVLLLVWFIMLLGEFK